MVPVTTIRKKTRMNPLPFSRASLAPNNPPAPLHENLAAGLLMDRECYLHDKYGVTTSPCLYLIRPDWHVAFRGSLESQRSLADYLERVFV